jgi:ABC-type uncharacterized transport system substrate-binding protein
MNRMLKFGLCFILMISLTCMLLAASIANESTSPEVNTTPTLNEGKKWRIGYAETDPYANFAGTFAGLVVGLEKLEWLTGIKDSDFPYQAGQDDSKVMWAWLTSHDVGPYIEFVADAHYSFIDDEVGIEQQINDRLINKKDIDLMIVMGTLPGTKLASENHHIPTLVFSSSNAVNSGIIKSIEDSGYDHIWAHMDPDRYVRQVEVFHDIFQYKTLGMVYENSELGRIYAAVDDVEEFARQRGIVIEREFVTEPKSQAQFEQYYQELKAANTKLASKVDAMYITLGPAEAKRLPELLQPFMDKKIPVFSQLGPEEVKHGALLSLARPNFDGVGLFGADTIVKVLKGTSPRALPQVYGDTPSIVLNLEVAELIGYQIPFDILLAADEVISKITR